ncbi:MAG: PilC/PilY family type IV pilus protein [Gammaproteobacteria bacterium]|nr:PilC/PilY family type IV pilus protein [Gammaproteobacteria bacterium]
MKISMRKITWMSVSFAIATLAGMPAIADDTELLLINPDPTKNPKPNVMFILDTSGSMTTEQTTTDPYDSNDTYAGACDTDHIYWTDVDVIPVCDASNLNYIEKSAYHCEFSRKQIAGIGSFTNTMVQYRDGGKDGMTVGQARWQYLASGYHTQPVECQADSGTHGDGRAGYLWAAAGTNLADPFTNDPESELAWGSAPRNLSYTFYDGNYLNWKNSPATVVMSRNAIMKAVATKVLSSVNNLNVGLMRFQGDNGGPVILDITDLDANRQTVMNAINSLPASGRTPLSEVMYESALFWRGMPAHYGTTTYTALTDPKALASTNPMVYEQPDWDVCAKNYNVLLTDGAPVEDFDTPGLIANLPNVASVLGYVGCDGAALSGGGRCLDDVAEYLSQYDLDATTPGNQLVTTHTIGFGDDASDIPILEETALNSGGQAFVARDVESLTRTLLDIIANINDRTLSFSAPAVSVNTFNRTQNLNDLYITTFGAKSKVHWPGNLKKYRIQNRTIVDLNDNDAVDPATGFFLDTAHSIWTVGGADGNDVRLGGAARKLPTPALRNIYSNYNVGSITAANNLIHPGNLSLLDADFGLTGAAGEPTLAVLLAWARGADVRDEDVNPGTLVRYAMGDPLHSQPAAIVYGGTSASPDVVVYTATNDGYLHAINGADGTELWSFIPRELLGNLTRLYFDPGSKYKQYGLDGNIVPVVKDVDRDGVIEQADGDFVYIVFGMRRGGDTYYAMDVTNKTAPSLMWTANFPEAGESWSTPVVARMDIASVTQNSDKAVLVFGGGYDTVHDTETHPSVPDAVGAGVYIVDLVSGTQLWRAGMDSGADLRLDEPGREMDRAIPNEVRVIDLSGDGLADRMYATDLGGQVWRFDITNGNAPATLVAGGVIAQLGAEGLATPTAADTRRFYNAPDVSLITDDLQQRRYIAVSVGSGYRAHPFDLSASDRFFSIRDKNVFNQLSQLSYDTQTIITDADLVEVSGTTQTVITSNDDGWKFTLPFNEKVLADSLTFNDEIFFVAFTPDSNAAATCSAGKGTNFLYRMSAVNGDPIVPNIDTLNPALADDERRTTLQQGGIAPTPTILFPSPDDSCTGTDCNQPPLGCVGVECFDPGFDPFPVRTLWTQDGIE